MAKTTDDRLPDASPRIPNLHLQTPGIILRRPPPRRNTIPPRMLAPLRINRRRRVRRPGVVQRRVARVVARVREGVLVVAQIVVVCVVVVGLLVRRVVRL